MKTYLEIQRSRDHSDYVSYWKSANAFFRGNPDGVVRVRGYGNDMFLTKEEFKAEMLAATLSRILCRANIPEPDPGVVSRMKTDRYLIENYLFRRHRHSGCRNLLVTKSLKKRYPQIDNQPWQE